MRRFALLVLIAGCAPSLSPGASGPVLPARVVKRTAAMKGRASVTCAYTVDTCVNHVIIVIQENRSFDNLFKDYPGADTQDYGLANCSGVGSGTGSAKKVQLQPLGFEAYQDPNHNWGPSLSAYDGGKMDGFCSNPDTPGTTPYSYVPNTFNEAKPLWDLAKNYVIADHLFPTQFGESFTAHLTLVAGNDEIVPGQEAVVDNPTSQPWGCDAPASTTTPYIDAQRGYHTQGPFPCFTQFRTLADALDKANISWKYYAPPIGTTGGDIWSAFSAISNVYHGPDWSKVVSPETTILGDAQSCTVSSCALPNVAWVVPDEADSDHAGSYSTTGPSWVASIVNTVHDNSYLWQSTAIIILWDDWGGWYDNVAPPQSTGFGGTFAKGDFRGLGIRVPMLIVSPFTYRLRAQGRNVSHTQYEFGSIVKFVEEAFRLPSLGSLADGYTDRRATSIRDAFDFKLNPSSGTGVKAPYPPSHFLNEKPTLLPPDND